MSKQNPETMSEMRERLAGEYECATQYPEREFNENDYKYRDFQAGWDSAHALMQQRAERLVECLEKVIDSSSGLIQFKCKEALEEWKNGR